MDANAGGLRPLFRCDSAIFTFLTYPVLQCVAVGLCEAASFPSGDQEARIGAQTLNMVFQDWGGVEEAKIGSAVVDDGRC
uniref:Uncharacterized protein n=1 Tax=Physcomitrium patens TaxID=3218 RepID=A0A2K1IC75_PHYPA|nr:hypothetical protein PHYPA_030362 [Physcomitrium patens]